MKPKLSVKEWCILLLVLGILLMLVLSSVITRMKVQP